MTMKLSYKGSVRLRKSRSKNSSGRKASAPTITSTIDSNVAKSLARSDSSTGSSRKKRNKTPRNKVPQPEEVVQNSLKQEESSTANPKPRRTPRKKDKHQEADSRHQGTRRRGSSSFSSAPKFTQFTHTSSVAHPSKKEEGIAGSGDDSPSLTCLVSRKPDEAFRDIIPQWEDQRDTFHSSVSYPFHL